MTTITSRQFNQDTSGAKRSAANGPVFITDRGRPAHVLMTVADYERMKGSKLSIVDMLWCPEAADIEFDPPRVNIAPRPLDLD